MFKEFNYVLVVSIWSLELWERKKMCEARKWSKIYTGEGNPIGLELFAERSDGKLFNILIPLGQGCFNYLHIKVAIDELESYRTCNCQTDELCIKHKIKTEKREIFVGSTFPDVIFNFEKETDK